MNINSQVQKGFSVVELIIVMLVIGVIVSIVYPSYIDRIKETQRGDVMTELQQINTRIESERIIYKKYSEIPVKNIIPPAATLTSGEFEFPPTGEALYKVRILDTSENSETKISGTKLATRSWKIEANPIADVGPEGKLTIDNKGEKCWKESCGMNDEWQKESN